jgi:hypothetical protein
MILKTLDFRKGKEANVLYDEWNYFDNIVSASNYFDENSGMTVVRCKFRDGNFVTIAIPHEAYLMSDSGKTIDRIEAAEVGHTGSTEGNTLPTMQDAVDWANKQ